MELHINNKYKRPFLGIIMSLFYPVIEVTSRFTTGDLIGFNGISRLSLCGWTSLWMLPIAGLCGISIGYLNENKYTKNLSMPTTCLLGMIITTIIEFITGYILNVKLGLHTWDYSESPFNLMGQICLLNCILWYFITPLVIWLDDSLNYILFGQEELYHILENYKELFVGLWKIVSKPFSIIKL